ncbi:MAG: hypothetical protein KGL39_34200 [Patescibacteria group bacterium]|nr:hypothetical protein [Patescibacteria group bacterium]
MRWLRIAALLLALAGGCAAQTVVQSACDAISSGGVTSTTLTFGSAVTAGDLIVAFGGYGSSGTIGLSDSRANSYTQDAGAHYYSNLWYAANVSGGSDTLTMTDTSSGTYSWCIAEISGAATASPLDASGYLGGSGSVNTTPTVTTANADDIIIAGYAEPYSSDNTGTITVGSPYTMASTVAKAAIASQSVTSAGSVTGATFTSQYGGYPSLATAAFKKASGPVSTCDHAISLLGAGCS